MKRNLKSTKKIILPIILACSLANSAAMHAHLPAAAAAGAGADAADKQREEELTIDQALEALKHIYSEHYSIMPLKQNLLAYLKESSAMYHIKAAILLTKQKDVHAILDTISKKIEDNAWKSFKEHDDFVEPIRKYSSVMNKFIDLRKRVLSSLDCLRAIELLNKFQEYIKRDIQTPGEPKVIEEA